MNFSYRSDLTDEQDEYNQTTKNFKTPKENEKHKLLNIQKSERETCRVIDERKQVEQGEREKKKGTLV